MIVVVGVGLSLALALMSYVKVSPHGLSYRSSETWSNVSTLFFTQAGAPEYRSVLSGPESAQPPDRIASLVGLYTVLATSDPVTKPLETRGLLDPSGVSSSVTATSVVSIVGAPTPLMKITATGTSPSAATRLTVAATNSFIKYLEARQIKAGIPETERVQVRVVEQPGKPLLAKPRSKTGLIAIFLAGLTLTVAAAFIRDNLRRGTERPVEAHDEPVAVPLAAVSEAPENVAPLEQAHSNGSLGDEVRHTAIAQHSSSRWTPRS